VYQNHKRYGKERRINAHFLYKLKTKKEESMLTFSNHMTGDRKKFITLKKEIY